LKNQENIFYVYIYLDPRKPGKYEYGDYCFLYEPFYVGKGKENRYLAHINQKETIKKSNLHKYNKIQNILEQWYELEDYIIKIKEYMSEDDSFELEKTMIDNIGRYDLNKGPLTNLTNGGRANNGHIYTEEQNKANSKRTKQWIKDNPEKQKMRVLKRNKKLKSEENRKKRSENCKQWVIDNPEKYEERERKRIESLRTEEARKKNSNFQKKRFSNPKERDKQSKRTREWAKNNPEKQDERQRKSTETKRKNAALKRPIKERCKQLVEQYNLNVTKPHPNCSVEKWQDFLEYLKTLIK